MTDLRYRDRTWLFDQYVTQNRGAPSVAKELGVSKSTVDRWLRLLDIPTRSRAVVVAARNRASAHLDVTPSLLAHVREWHNSGRTQIELASSLGISRKVVQRLYAVAGVVGDPSRRSPEHDVSLRRERWRADIERWYAAGETTSEIGARLGISQGAAWDAVSALGLGRRTRNEAAAKRRGLLNLTSELRQVLEGELLGDGCLRLGRSGLSAYFVYGTTRSSYCRWLAARLNALGLEHTGPVKEWCRPGHNTQSRFATRRFPELADEYRRWYRPKKRVPGDLELTPISAFHWYVGDGSMKQNYSPYIVIAAMCFPTDDVDRLVGQLRDQGIDARRPTHPHGPPVNMRKDAALAFLDWIGPPPPEVAEDYAYKWRRR